MISQRLSRLESIISADTKEDTGKPVIPLGMSDQEYPEAIEAKRIELGLKPSEPIPILALC